jgi:hypothetical protein
MRQYVLNQILPLRNCQRGLGSHRQKGKAGHWNQHMLMATCGRALTASVPAGPSCYAVGAAVALIDARHSAVLSGSPPCRPSRRPHWAEALPEGLLVVAGRDFSKILQILAASRSGWRQVHCRGESFDRQSFSTHVSTSGDGVAEEEFDRRIVGRATGVRSLLHSMMQNTRAELLPRPARCILALAPVKIQSAQASDVYYTVRTRMVRGRPG